MESCKLPDVPLFRGLTETETAVAIEALRMRRRPFAKGEVLLEVAAESGEVLLLDTDQLLRCGCEPWRWKMTQNLLRIAARKNLGLAQRSLYTAPKTIRGRITAYFSVLARRSGSMQFNLPFDRQQLADHLGVDRSALSNALSQMQREGLLTLDRRKVELRQVDEL